MSLDRFQTLLWEHPFYVLGALIFIATLKNLIWTDKWRKS